ncbi:helix-turn-helix transcriptional regulator [Gryllotalpicola koreensis]|uniref:HTH luxR-type domain-containing protein n=1 Tax=Gryllotalpicola koreensis TaxID=993086 RepID=A0ABP7ZPV9_9MICO
MTAADELRAAVRGQQWAAVDRLFDQHFFALLLTSPELVRDAFAALPNEWYRQHPRHVMTRGIAAVTGPLPLVAAEAEEAFAAWVASQPEPAARDLLGVLAARLRALMSARRFFEADTIADRMRETIRGAREHAGFTDVLPPALLRIGTAKLLVGDVLTAFQMFADAHRWANAGPIHPIDPMVRDHLALTAALNEDYIAAVQWLEGRGERTTREDGVRYRYETVGLVARALIAVGQADSAQASAAVDNADDEGTRLSELWWVAVHARARYELFWGDPHRGVSLIRRSRQLHAAGAMPVLAAKLLRADMADLLMMLGELPAAARELDALGVTQPHPAVQASKIRLELLRGRVDEAAQQLADVASAEGLGPALSVLGAQVERLAGGEVSQRAARRAAFFVRDSGARSALLEADHELRAQLLALMGGEVVPAGNDYGYRFRPRLTRRESEVLRALGQFETVRDIAAALHVSPNTVKTHLQALYRKFGVHTRDEVLRHLTE